jgi:hypothetical protein
MLIVDIDTGRTNTANTTDRNEEEDPATRWQLKQLDSTHVCIRIRQDYNNVTKSLTKMLDKAMEAITPGTDFKTRRTIVDTAYQTLMECINKIAKKQMGSYKPQVVKRKIDKMIAFLQDHVGGINGFLRMFKRARRSGTTSIKISSRDLTKSPEEDAIAYYEGIFQSLPAPPPHPPWRPTNEIHPSLQRDASFVENFFKFYDINKSCGKDGLHTKFARVLGQDTKFNAHIMQLFDLCNLAGTTPTEWNCSIVNPIPKGSKETTIDVQRPIALTAMLRRCYEKLVHQGIQHTPELANAVKVNYAQAGFQPRQSTMLHVMASHEHQRQTDGIQIFIDLKAAYDRVNLKILFQILEQRGVPRNIINILWSLFAGCASQISINGKLTRSFQRFTGLFQGSLLAPMLWNIYVDGLADALNGKIPRGLPFSIFFADDIKLQYDRRNIHQTWALAQMHLDLTSTWCGENNMIPGIKKCGVIIPRDCDTTGLPPLTLNGQPLPITDSYKYLGFEMTSKGLDWISYVNRIVTKARNTLSFARIEGMKWRPALRVAAYKTFVRSILEYGAPLLHCYLNNDIPRNRVTAAAEKAQRALLWTAMEQVQDEALGWIFDTRRVTVTHRSLAAIIPMRDRLLQLATTFTEHLAHAPAFHPTSILLKEQPVWNQRFDARMLHQCRETPLSRLYQVYKNTPSNSRIKLLDEWLKERNREDFHSAKYGRLASYCSAKSRTQAGMDFALDIRDPVTGHAALNWRLNKYHQALCKCGGTLSRSHINTCTHLGNIPMAPYQARQLHDAFDAFSNPIVEQVRALSGDNFCVLDQLLNERQYETFYATLNGLLADGNQRSANAQPDAAPSSQQTTIALSPPTLSQQRRAIDRADEAREREMDNQDDLDQLLSDDDVDQGIGDNWQMPEDQLDDSDWDELNINEHAALDNLRDLLQANPDEDDDQGDHDRRFYDYFPDN